MKLADCKTLLYFPTLFPCARMQIIMLIYVNEVSSLISFAWGR